MFSLHHMDSEFHTKHQYFENALQHYVDPLKQKTVLYASIAYSLFSGGKRVRPLFLISAYETINLNSDIQPAIIPACALEMIHTYSLIHDDLPCMDNSTTRRGKPTNHQVYGEDIALLAGDALLTHAFTLLSSDESRKFLDDSQIVRLVHCLSYHSGINGMVEGQAFELIQRDQKMENYHYIDEHKTAALFASSMLMGGIAAGAGDDKLIMLKELGRTFGHAFQIADDIADFATDVDSSNIVKLLGKEKSLELYHSYMQEVGLILHQLEENHPNSNLKRLITYIQQKSNIL